MLLQLAGLVISLGLTMYITRSIGAIEYNAYAISFSWITLLSHISLVGFD
ncbi:MAG: O-antigen/teichoic acid export membrane protein, partial [Parvicellaceae bacterium]